MENNIRNFLIGKKVTNIQVIRGLGIIPTRFEIELCQNEEYHIIEVEANFRIIYNNNCLICFDDLYLKINYEEMSPQKYRKQKAIENTLLYSKIKQNYKKIIGKEVKNVNITYYGDVNIYLSNKLKIQIINDTHLNDSCIVRIICKNSFEEFITKNGKVLKIPKVIYELKNEAGKIKCLM